MTEIHGFNFHLLQKQVMRYYYKKYVYVLPLRCLQNSSAEICATMFKFTSLHFIQAQCNFSADQHNYVRLQQALLENKPHVCMEDSTSLLVLGITTFKKIEEKSLNSPLHLHFVCIWHHSYKMGQHSFITFLKIN